MKIFFKRNVLSLFLVVWSSVMFFVYSDDLTNATVIGPALMYFFCTSVFFGLFVFNLMRVLRQLEINVLEAKLEGFKKKMEETSNTDKV